jgi:hypothetical protein
MVDSNEKFAEDLATLVARASPFSTPQALLSILLDEAEAQRGEIIRAQLAAGPWPPVEKIAD